MSVKGDSGPSKQTKHKEEEEFDSTKNKDDVKVDFFYGHRAKVRAYII